MKKAVSLLLVIAILISVTVIAFAYSKTGEELLISNDNISYNISENLYGVSLEDVSFAVDGGLNSNLVNNNSFEYGGGDLFAWNIDAADYSVQSDDGLNKNNRNYLSVTVDGQGTIINNGYTEIYDYKTYNINEKKQNTPDMGFEKSEKYEFSAYFKNAGFKGDIIVSLKAKGNSEEYRFSLDGYDDWTKVISQIQSDVTADGGLSIRAEGIGTFLMDFVSLVPIESHGFYSEEWKYSSVREDFYGELQELSPKFIRFPGSLVSKGDGAEHLYNWKNTIGPLEERPQTDNPWYDGENGRRGVNSNAVGFYEYFMLCEDLGAAPIPAVSAGINVRSREDYEKMRVSYENGDLTEKEWQAYLDKSALKPGTDAWKSYVEDILDLIEFANSGIDSEWGAVRAENGHIEPFYMNYIEIDSEIGGDIYWRNFDGIYKAIKKAFPQITVIASPKADIDSDEFKEIKSILNSEYPDVILGESYFSEGGALFGKTHRYDGYERNGAKAFIGEWSVKSDGYGTVQTKNNIWSAIEEAAYLTGVERNADVVQMISSAPLFAKVNAQCEDVNLIWFDSQGLVLTPDYYVQMLFANNIGNKLISSNLNMEDQGVYESVTVDTNKQIIYVKLVNTQSKNVALTLNVQGFGEVDSAFNQYMSENFKAACNEINGRLHVAPSEREYMLKNNKLNFMLEGLSVNVIRIPYGEKSESALYALPKIEIITPYIHPAFKVVIPCVIMLLLIITVIAVLLNRHSLKKREKKRPSDNGKKKK